MDRGVWQTTVHRVPKSWTWLSAHTHNQIGCYCLSSCTLHVYAVRSLTQSCPTLWPLDCSLPGSSVHGIFQARMLEWAVISFFQELFLTQVSSLCLLCPLHWQADSLPLVPPLKAPFKTPQVWQLSLNRTWDSSFCTSCLVLRHLLKLSKPHLPGHSAQSLCSGVFPTSLNFNTEKGAQTLSLSGILLTYVEFLPRLQSCLGMVIKAEQGTFFLKNP